MSTSATRNSSERPTAALRLGTFTATVNVYVLPFSVSVATACMWLVLISLATEATESSLLVMALGILPGAVLMGISYRERKHWYEYVLVWIGFFTAVPLYGIVLLIGGYGLVLARAWRRHWPHPTQGDEG